MFGETACNFVDFNIYDILNTVILFVFNVFAVWENSQEEEKAILQCSYSVAGWEWSYVCSMAASRRSVYMSNMQCAGYIWEIFLLLTCRQLQDITFI